MDVMIDLETMSTESNAAICSIGAVKFSFDGGILDQFYCTVDVLDCKKYGLHVSKDTVYWWSQQPKHVFEELRKNNVSLKDALNNFSEWYGNISLPTWGCGAGFDNVILDNAFKAVGMIRPWKYWDDRCYRTIKELIKIPEEDRTQNYHNALEDALHQTKHLLRILNS